MTQTALAKKLGISKQALWQRQAKEERRCTICGAPSPVHRCERCWDKVRQRLGMKRRNLNARRYRI